MTFNKESFARGEVCTIVDHRHIGTVRTRVISHRIPLFSTSCSWANSYTFFGGQCRLVDKGTTCLGIESLDTFRSVGPGDFTERFAVQKLSVLAVQAVEIAISVGLDQGFDFFSLVLHVDQHWRVDTVIVPNVVGTVLKVPLVASIVRIQSNNGTGVKVIALTNFAVEIG